MYFLCNLRELDSGTFNNITTNKNINNKHSLFEIPDLTLEL